MNPYNIKNKLNKAEKKLELLKKEDELSGEVYKIELIIEVIEENIKKYTK